MDTKTLSRGDYVEWLRQRVHDLEAPSGPRNRAALACFAIAQTHHHAVVLLCESGLFASAFSLLRSCFESYVRGQWSLHCATDKELRAFVVGKEPPKLNELIIAIERVPGFEERILSKIKASHWNALCAYTHSGGLHLQRWQSEDAVEPRYSNDEIDEVLSFAEAIGSMSAIATLGVADKAAEAATVLDVFRGRSEAD